MKINIEISCGELLDKLTILEIKSEKITNQKKLDNIIKEKEQLKKFSKILKDSNQPSFTNFYSELLEVNKKLWKIEDEIRICEKNNDFNEEFIQLARDVYFTNDLRFEIKNRINIFYKSGLIEEKEYIDYKSKK